MLLFSYTPIWLLVAHAIYYMYCATSNVQIVKPLLLIFCHNITFVLMTLKLWLCTCGIAKAYTTNHAISNAKMLMYVSSNLVMVLIMALHD